MTMLYGFLGFIFALIAFVLALVGANTAETAGWLLVLTWGFIVAAWISMALMLRPTLQSWLNSRRV